ncbi:L,D-transpeptidase family protein [Candidatus Nucleicultrix amoebiphila]|jgi:murein L,D-transpeptidase YcbB/YkuD|uniref:L,D-transpeptidase family protein n=1 Tax=Candidatus Nucleicultrix amoebiphila TaxID=1509244 RepID=UPI000A269F35|nr:L,D-transpeptidase family protein [Candidatus Nucleicultrix amoebiphila]
MKKLSILHLLVIVFSLNVSINMGQARAEEFTTPVELVQTTESFSHDIKHFLHKLIKEKKVLSSQEKFLVDLYTAREFEPLWLDDSGNLKDSTYYAIETLLNAANEGVDPEDYAQTVETFKGFYNDPNQRLKAEFTLSKAIDSYIDDLTGSRLSPKKIDKRLYLNPDPVESAHVVLHGFQNDPSGLWLKTFTLESPEYQTLKGILAKYRSIESRGGWPSLPTGPALKKGMKEHRVSVLRQILFMQGDLEDETQSPNFDDAVEQAVKRFQNRHGIEPDGIVGNGTVTALNIPVNQKIKQILISMERWRWLPQNLGERYVMVNIAGMELKAVEKGKSPLSMKVIVGMNYRQTPVFSSSIYSIRFNPVWNVPRLIAVQDKLKLIHKDPGYLRKKGFVVYDGSGSQINPDDVDWSNVTAENFDYHFKQLPGSMNALGKIRFSIRSPFDVYLHSTSDPQLFNKSSRYLSSGCIRVEKPVELAMFVFNNPQQWPREKIESSMEGNITNNVDLKNPVPVHITYFTVWEDSDGLVHFANDIYGQDQRIWLSLEEQRKGRFSQKA